MANLSTSTLSDTIKVMYERRLLTRALARLVHGNWAREATISKYGSYELRKFGSLSAVTSALTEGTTPAEQSAPSLTTVTLDPNYYGSWLGYTDELDMENFDPVVSESSAVLGEQAGLSADTLYRTELITDATVDYSNGGTAPSDLAYPSHEISYADIVYQVAELENQSARPIEGQDFVVIIHPHTYASLMQDETFVNMFTEEAPDSAIRNGYVGRLLRCRVYVSANAYEEADVGSGSTADVYSALFLGWESYGSVGMTGLMPSSTDTAGPEGGPLTGTTVSPVSIIMKPLGAGDDPLNQRGTLGWKMAFDVEVLNSNWCRELRHTNVFSND